MNKTKERINKMLKKSELILNAGKPKPMTNEEWFCKLSTEEKAKEFVTIQYQERDICNVITDEMIQSCLQRWLVWLKQPHNSSK